MYIYLADQLIISAHVNRFKKTLLFIENSPCGNFGLCGWSRITRVVLLGRVDVGHIKPNVSAWVTSQVAEKTNCGGNFDEPKNINYVQGLGGETSSIAIRKKLER